MSHVAAITLENEPGVVYYGFAKSVEDEHRYVVVEVYRDQSACAAHGDNVWVTESVPKMLELTEGMPQLVQYVSPAPIQCVAPRGHDVSAPDGMTDLERLIELQAIFHLKGRRDHADDRKDWATYAELHTDDYVAMSITSEPIVGGKAGGTNAFSSAGKRPQHRSSPGGNSCDRL